MPGLNGTGPMGQGASTGRGLGNCNPANDTKKDINTEERAFGRGLGRGAGRGLGRGCGQGFGGRGFRSKFTNNNDEA